MKTLSIIVVNYHSEKYLSACLKSIIAQKLSLKLQLILVNADNSNVKAEFSQFDDCKVVNLPVNNGFGYAVNEGFKFVKGDYVLILNPDVLINSGLSDALEYLGLHHDVIIGADLYTVSNKSQKYAFGDFHSTKTILKNKFGYPNGHKRARKRTHTIRVDWVSGTSMLMLSNTFRKLRGFDESYFMYFEDQDLCYRANEIGIESVVITNFKVLHYGGKSFRQNEQKLQAYNQSLMIFFNKHGTIIDRLFISIVKPFYDIIKFK